jgi:predicted RNase H-like nuclease (RuvC/YqgF family)
MYKDREKMLEKKREWAKKNRKGSTEGSTEVVQKVLQVIENVEPCVEPKELRLSDLGVDLKELGVQSCGPGLPILLVDMPTNDQIQGLCKVIHALNGDMEWEPRCGMGNSF